MRGALEAGGQVAGILADSLERAALNREHRTFLMNGQLVLISPYDPAAGFNVGHAMQRNKLIYAIADAALVVKADHEKGGTWAGAIEQLEKLRLVPVYVRSNGQSGKGLEALKQKGALPWPDPETPEALKEALAAEAAPRKAAPAQAELF
jgi:predicted Rossmann fold nucleotide-binding protein DprA/Smf involved in DNA uptake